MEAWSYWVGERRGQSWGLRLLAESSGSQTVLILGASGVCANFLSPLQVQSPSALVEEWQAALQAEVRGGYEEPSGPAEVSLHEGGAK